MPSVDPNTRNILRLTLAPGLGPVLTRRAIEAFGTPEAALRATESTLRRVKGIGEVLARQISAALPDTDRLADEELALAGKLGIALLSLGSPDYPPLLAQTPDPPPILYVRGRIDHAHLDRYPVAIVGSRTCTHYGREQSERFAAHLAGSGLTIISGGARGVDTAAHRAALRAGGRTIAVLGCGLADCYPPDNEELFDQIAAGGDGGGGGGRGGGGGGGGAVISELPLRTPPNAENFPARNRIISGLALGVLVVEAGRRSGSLITARVAAEDHGREVFALPARVDSSASEGSLNLLKSGGAQLVTHPEDIIQSLEAPARHLFGGTHADRYSLFGAPAPSPEESSESRAQAVAASGLTDTQQAILGALEEPRTLDQLCIELKLDAAKLRSEMTMLEIRRRVTRAGSRFERVTAAT